MNTGGNGASSPGSRGPKYATWGSVGAVCHMVRNEAGEREAAAGYGKAPR